MRLFIKILLTFLFWITLESEGISQQLVHHIYNSESGLPSSEAYSCTQDEDGNIWITTDNGVSRFNSEEFKNYTTEDGLPGTTIFKVFKDPSNRLWFSSHNRSLCYYDKKTDRFIPYTHNNLLQTVGRYEFVDDILFHKEENHLTVFSTMGHLEITASGKQVYSTEEDSYQFDLRNERNLCYGVRKTQKKIQIFTNDLDTTLYIDKLLPTKPRSLGSRRIGFNENILFVNNVLIHVKGRTIQVKILPNAICDALVSNESIYIGLFANGLTQLDRTTLEEKNTTLNGYTISGLMIDNEQSIWATSTELGLIYFPYSHFDNHLVFNDKRNIVQSKTYEDEVIFVTKSCDLWEFKSSTKQYRQVTTNGNPYSFLTKIRILNDLIFVDTKSNEPEMAYNLVTKKFQQVKNPSVDYILNDSIGISGHILGLYIRKTETRQEIDTLIYGKYISSISQLDKSQFLVSLRPGLLIVDASNLEKVSCRYLSTEIEPTSFTIHDKQAIITTKSHGVWTYSNGTLKPLSQKLPKVRYSGSAVHGQTLFLSSSNGLISYHFPTKKIQHYTRYHGLPEVDLLNVHAIKGEVWTTSRSGISRLNLEAKTIPLRPKLKIEYFIVDGDTLHHKLLNHDHKMIEFRLSSLCYKCLGDVRYTYRLLGLSEKWLTTKESEIRMNQLEPGDYTLEVIALTPENEYSEIARYAFQVKQPYWQTWWFQGLIIAFLILSFTLVYFIQRNIHKKREKLLKKLTYNRQLALRKYLDPHFIFNALNSIQSLITSDNKNRAQSFIVSFSRLIREYLDAGVKEEISLFKELEILDRYITLEETRLNQIIDFTYRVDQKIDLNSTLIPSLFIQPIIENSIWHGFRTHKEDASIDLSIKQFSKHLEISIIDNGSGIHSDLHRTTLSNSSKINQERLKLLSTLYTHEYRMSITNKHNNQGDIIGCEVTLILPYRLTAKNDGKH